MPLASAGPCKRAIVRNWQRLATEASSLRTYHPRFAQRRRIEQFRPQATSLQNLLGSRGPRPATLTLELGFVREHFFTNM
jgi:hypothetical protein